MSDGPKRMPLGRGLATLLGEEGARVLSGPGAPRTVPIEAIRPSPFQPRRRFAETELDGLVQSIREKGVIQPLLVRPIEDAIGYSADSGANFELVAGERRWRAAQRAGRPEPRQRQPRDADTLALERELGATLGLRTTLTPKGRGGSLTLHYASLDQLDRILALLRCG